MGVESSQYLLMGKRCICECMGGGIGSARKGANLW